MPYSEGVTFGAGTLLAFEDPDEDAEYPFVPLTNAVEIGDVGEVSEAQDTSALSDETDVYSAGPEAGGDIEYSFTHTPGDENYQKFLALVDAKITVKMQITYKSGDIVVQPVLLLGKKLAAAQRKEKLTMKVSAKQSGKSVWTEAE